MMCANSLRPHVARAVSLTALAIGLLAGPALATRPVEPLPAGWYSFDLASPTVLDGIVGASDVLQFDPTQPQHPQIAFFAEQIGLQTCDDLDCLSTSNTGLPDGAQFMLLFSVDRGTVGDVPPDPFIVSFGIPYNVMDQAERGHAAADQYIAFDFYTRAGVAQRGAGANSVLVRNQFNQGGTGHGAEPPASADETVAEGTPEDEIDGMSSMSSTGSRGATGLLLYFTLTPESPSLPFLSPSPDPSGADIFAVEPERFGKGGTPRPFATAAELGLVPADDIDAVIVFDFNSNGRFDFTPPIQPDQVIFSLTRESPTVGTGSGADIFSITFGEPLLLWALADQFGLGDPNDNIDGLNYIQCDSAEIEQCAARHGIRIPVFNDWDHDGTVDLRDYVRFADCMSGPYVDPQPAFGTPEKCLTTFSIEEDGDVDLSDFRGFQQNFGFVLELPMP